MDDLAQRIQAKILTGEVVTGSWLRQESLANEFGVSRTPVREALRKLQAGGVVDVLPRRGAVVRGPTAREIREAYVVRAELEGLAAELATIRILDRQLDQLREAEELFRRAVETFVARKKIRAAGVAGTSDDTGWIRANDLFHEVVQEAADNDRLRRTIVALHRSFPRKLTWSALAEDSRLLSANADEHRHVLAAVQQGNPAEARQAMKDHILRAGELVATWFDRPLAPL